MRPPLRTRADLVALADDLLAAVTPYTSPGGALITLPGTPGGYGTAVDALEGFARTFLLAAMRLRADPADPAGLAERYARGLTAGTDPSAVEAWVRPSEHGQAKVEAASLALALDWSREQVWDRLSPTAQHQVVDYLAEVVGDRSYPRCNWLWFQIVVETFLRSVGGPVDEADITTDLQVLDSFYAGQGWYRDGDERAYDHYSGWAMQLYPTLWAQMRGAGDAAAERAEADRDRLGRYLTDLVLLTGADGSPLLQGRSLTYRFAAAAPLWAGILAGMEDPAPAVLRRCALGIVNHFLDHGVPNDRGLLDIGWWGPWRPLAQTYSGPGSPYWAVKGLLGLLLPADHLVWTQPSSGEPTARSAADVRLSVHAPGWVVSSTSHDGIVRVANHGTDHDQVGSDRGDSPLYARLGYSTATAPLLDPQSWTDPVDQSVVLVDSAGRRSHRAGMARLSLPDLPEAQLAGSLARAHWVQAAAHQQGHGSGSIGSATRAGDLLVVSVLRSHWEVRLVHLAAPAPAATALEVGGWAMADDAGVAVHTATPAVTLTSTRGAAVLLAPTAARLRVEHRDQASPLGAHAAVAVATWPARSGWTWAALALTGARTGQVSSAVDHPQVRIETDRAEITWPDGATSTVPLTGLPSSPGGDG
ncbi:DUF2264 domain-containing protein [Ruania albidiflava]|uniref:DUF2264 domain-containing protein n=1 Tax=Ruania albidiflava TaxID=366586 RepID=UPI0023F1CF6F|nr:DUF2264 domain-containing protein [Ruania albidiflava]